MAEHLRKNNHQWVDGEVFLVWDRFYDQPERLPRGSGIYGTLEEALECASSRRGWEDRTVILRLPAILAQKLTG